MSTAPATIGLLLPDDAEAFFALRREALLGNPLVFAASPDDDLAGTVEAVAEMLGRGPESVVLGAFAPQLVGSVGLVRNRHQKAAHKAHLWGMYVTSTHRGRGVGPALLAAALRHAGSLAGVSWVHLSVSSAAPLAHRLYTKMGFKEWGCEPESLSYQGRIVAEHHLALHLPSRE